MKKYISVTSPEFKRADGSKYERKPLPKGYCTAPPHIFDKKPVVIYDSSTVAKRKVKK